VVVRTARVAIMNALVAGDRWQRAPSPCTAFGHRGGERFHPVLRYAGRTPGRAAAHGRSILRTGTEQGRSRSAPIGVVDRVCHAVGPEKQQLVQQIEELGPARG
jgi:hypothetical protein